MVESVGCLSTSVYWNQTGYRAFVFRDPPRRTLRKFSAEEKTGPHCLDHEPRRSRLNCDSALRYPTPILGTPPPPSVVDSGDTEDSRQSGRHLPDGPWRTIHSLCLEINHFGNTDLKKMSTFIRSLRPGVFQKPDLCPSRSVFSPGVLNFLLLPKINRQNLMIRWDIRNHITDKGFPNSNIRSLVISSEGLWIGVWLKGPDNGTCGKGPRSHWEGRTYVQCVRVGLEVNTLHRED